VEISKKVLKIATIALSIALISSCFAVYHLWTTKTVTMNARITTFLDLAVFLDKEETIPLTTYDWGEYGAGDKWLEFYFKNLGNDIGYLTYNLTGSGWILKKTSGLSHNYYYYTDNNFNFSIFGSTDGINPSLLCPVNPEGSGETTYGPLNALESGYWFMRCWTTSALAGSSCWTLNFKLYDNLA